VTGGSTTAVRAEPGGSDVAAIAVAFSRVLRGAGVAVPMSATIAFTEALGVVGVADRDATYWAGRATLVRRPEDREVYDRAFRVFWEDRQGAGPGPEEPPPLRLSLALDTGDDGEGGEDDPDEDPSIELRFSANEVLRHKDFAEYSDEELAEAQTLMARFRLVGSPRRSLRLTAADVRAQRPDLRRTVRATLRAGGEPVRRHWRTHTTRPRRLVLLLDVSGSMEPYARALVRFVHAAVAGRQKVEAFALGTRLTRITRELSSRDPDVALRAAATRVVDWSGGTRLGEGMRRFNDDWGQRGMARGAIVVILSDGWDRGDPELLGEQMARLHRVAHRVIWVNPLKVTPGYAPLARGMAAALPYVDGFVEGHSIAAMEDLAALIGDDRNDRRGGRA
jgi:uncharacterized protein with von Willebrand factor type A (vWA) domain